MKTSASRTLVQLAALALTLSISTQFMSQQLPAQSEIEAPFDAPEELNAGWEFRRDNRDTWKSVAIPSTFESHEGVRFDGIGHYRIDLKKHLLSKPADASKRLVLRFEGAATRATVRCNGQILAEHLGGWTPFECDLTEPFREPSAKTCELLVEVDELVGHNSQGFLPVFAPHFGGLWKPVQARWTSPLAIDSKQLFVWGHLPSRTLHFEIPIGGLNPTALGAFVDPTKSYRVCLNYRLAESGPAESGPAESGTSTWNNHCIELSEPQIQELRRNSRLVLEGSLEVPDPVAWDVDQPHRYDVEIGIQEISPNHSQNLEPTPWIDRIETQAAFREIRHEGSALILNGKPLVVRGVLNWGYAPPSLAPSLDAEHWRKELQTVKDLGFNLMKFCLWVPPKGYLQMADEMGVLVWIEYPTWHSQWTQEALPTLEKEFDEFFCYDRNHPSVILRSLTCETGPSADLEVLRKLYDRCHSRIPGSIVEDDSSWIQWNRIHDFYDDHPYGNNHTWVPTLARLKNYIEQHGIKPLVLGEAIAADTWVVPGSFDAPGSLDAPGSFDAIRSLGPDTLLQSVQRGDSTNPREEPFWWPLAYRANHAWAQDRQTDMGLESVARLDVDSKRYALAMRKFQIETLRRELPEAGYVVSVLRDFPFAAMGLIDFQGNPKWDAKAWEWHGKKTLLLQTDQDRRSFWGDEPFCGKVLIDPGTDKGIWENCRVRWTWTRRRPSDDSLPTDPKAIVASSVASKKKKLEDVSMSKAGLLEVLELNELLPAVSIDALGEPQPVCWNLCVELIDRSVTIPQSPNAQDRKAGEQPSEKILCRNTWDLWQIPRPSTQRSNTIKSAPTKLFLHHSCSEQTARELRSLIPSLGMELSELPPLAPLEKPAAEAIWIAQRFDASLLDWLEQGGRVLMRPDGSKGSLPQSDHWFLRGGPIVSQEPTWNELHRLIVDLQHFDLAGRVVPDVQWLDQMQPMVMLWDNHDIDKVKTHGLVFASRVGQVVLLVDCLSQTLDRSPASALLLGRSLDWLANLDPTRAIRAIRAMDGQTVQGLRNKLQEQTLSLTEQAWEFRPDQENQGLSLGWHRPSEPDTNNLKSSQKTSQNGPTLDKEPAAGWSKIQVGKHWESQGYPSLDGWAWYRTQIQLPENWPEGRLYLQIDGADDYIEVYTQGRLTGSAGNRQTRTTAFEEKASFLIAETIKGGQIVSISIRIEDWQGAGGLFRPIRLSTTELGNEKNILELKN